MTGHDPRTYGEGVGAEYDALYPEEGFETDAAVSALAALTEPTGGPILEFGIGTGRLALPLVKQGVRVAGIEASPAMVEGLRAKSGADDIDVVVGDFADARVAGRFAVVLLAFNAIFALPTRDAQVACLQNAARHLAPGGVVVVEAFVLGPDQLHGGWSVQPRLVEHDHVELELSRYDAATHRIERSLVHLRPAGVRVLAVEDTYAWPGELDLMARAAGLRLRSRCAGWRGEEFGSTSKRHVSVYECNSR